MGRSHRTRIKCLGPKLHEIRRQLDLTQEQMIARLNCPDEPLRPSSISEYENGKREPPLTVLLRYAKVAGVIVDMLIDDDLDLPERLPIITGHEWIMKCVRMGHARQ